MAIHDWTRVKAGIFHAFHQQWIIALSNELNEHVLPPEYYALPEQHAAGFGPDVLTLQNAASGDLAAPGSDAGSADRGVLLAAPQVALTAETDMEFYRRKQTQVVVRHVSGDCVVAMIEVVSPGNKSTRHAVRSLVEKAAQLLDHGVHLLIVDVLPPGRHDPYGIHAAIWEELSGQEPGSRPDRPLTLAAYETALTVRAFVRVAAVGDALPEMPLFLEPNGCVPVPLEATYQTAFSAMPRRWRAVLESTPPADR